MKKRFMEFMIEASNNSSKNTLGQVVTELFPCLYFLAGRALSEDSTEFPKSMWSKIAKDCRVDKTTSPFYLMGPSNEKTRKYSTLDGLNSIWNGYGNGDDSARSGMKDKLLQAEQIYEAILVLAKNTKGKKLEVVQWGDQCQPEGIPVNEADIYLSWSDGTWTGISLKATKSKSGTVSLKNRTVGTWFKILAGEEDAADIIDSIQSTVYKVYPKAVSSSIKDIYKQSKTLSSKDVSADVEDICKWISQTDTAKLAEVEKLIKTTFNTAFANEMNKCVKKMPDFKQKLIDVLVDKDDGESAYQLLVWKASNNGVDDMTQLNVLDDIRMAKSIQFAQDGLSGIKMTTVGNDASSKTYAINARQSHSLHNDKIDTLLQDVDLTSLNDTFTATLFKGVNSLQVMLKLTSN